MLASGPHLEDGTSRPKSPSVLTSDDLCHPMVARAPFTREGWTFELKHDGFRAFVRSGPSPELRSRWGRSMAEAFPEILDTLRAGPAATLDGELIVPDREGRSDFDSLRRRLLMRRTREVARSRVSMPGGTRAYPLLTLGFGIVIGPTKGPVGSKGVGRGRGPRCLHSRGNIR
jgi:ATP dependent DNA ligase-like protein